MKGKEKRYKLKIWKSDRRRVKYHVQWFQLHLLSRFPEMYIFGPRRRGGGNVRRGRGKKTKRDLACVSE